MKRAATPSTLVLLLATATAAQAAGPDGEPEPILSLERALQISDANQPNLRQAHANTDAADARVGEARSPLLPQLSGSLSYQRTTANAVARPGYTPVGVAGTIAAQPATFATHDFYSVGVSLNQLVYDFGQTIGRFKSAEASAVAQRDTELATQLQTHLAVRTAFFAARAEKALLEVARSALANYERHTQQIEGFVSVGTRPQIDLAQARTDQANAKAALIMAENNYEIGKAQLNQMMGVQQSTAYTVTDDSMPPLPNEDMAVGEQVKVAFKTRPELAAQDNAVISNQELITSAKGGYFPSIGVAASFQDLGYQPDSLTWNFSATAQLSWNLFDGLNTPSRTREARANVVAAQAASDSLLLQIRLEVEQQHWAVRAAKESLVAAHEAEFNARERLSLAEGRYQTGVGSIIELGDAQVAYTTAAASRVQAEYNLASARAGLLKALGGR